MTVTTTAPDGALDGDPTATLWAAEEPFDSEDAVRLRAAAHIERVRLGAERPAIDVLDTPSGLVSHIVLRDAHGVALACAALVVVADGVVEIQRFYVRFDARGSGTGSSLLGALEGAARSIGAGAVVVETTPALEGTITFFERHGYQYIAPWGPYVSSPNSVCFSKVL